MLHDGRLFRSGLAAHLSAHKHKAKNKPWWVRDLKPEDYRIRLKCSGHPDRFGQWWSCEAGPPRGFVSDVQLTWHNQFMDPLGFGAVVENQWMGAGNYFSSTTAQAAHVLIHDFLGRYNLDCGQCSGFYDPDNNLWRLCNGHSQAPPVIYLQTVFVSPGGGLVPDQYGLLIQDRGGLSQANSAVCGWPCRPDGLR